MLFKINLSLSGGGIKGITHVGGLEALIDYGIEVNKLAGSSAGAIIAALYGAGYSISGLKEIIFSKDFTDFKEGLCPIRLIKNFGLYSGKNFLNWFENLLLNKNIRYFKDLKKDIYIITAEVTSRKKVIFSKENTPEMSVAKAVRMSIGIPIFYIPYSFNNKLYVDGGVVNNFPLRLFKESRYPTIGFMITDKADQENKIHNLAEYIKKLIKMMISVNEEYQINSSNAYIARIKTPESISALDFSISYQKRVLLYNLGYVKVRKMLENKLCDFIRLNSKLD